MEKGYLTKELGDSTEYNYLEMEWFSVPIHTGTNHWSEPYFDKGAGDMLMCTFSHPFFGDDSTIVGVLTADISLNEGIAQIVNTYDKGNGGTTFLLSPGQNLLFGDTTLTAKDDIVFQSNLKDTEWVLGHIIPHRELMRPLHRVMNNFVFLFIFTLLAVCTSIFYTIHRLSKPEIKKNMQMEAELGIAAKIQKGMLPKSRNYYVSALMIPAKEVGGDFYNYFTDDNRLYFVIADVSGKGVPAALVMAIATQFFKIVAPKETDPSHIIGKINNQIANDNQTAMFITMIVGILDIEKREMQLCNAGHNPPYFLSPDCKEITLPKNCPVGLFEDFPYQSQTIPFPQGSRLVLYTDGVTEAENAVKEQFGKERLVNVLKTQPNNICEATKHAVHTFAGRAEQSDDITVMTISYEQ